jgi:hypothetical protein
MLDSNNRKEKLRLTFIIPMKNIDFDVNKFHLMKESFT